MRRRIDPGAVASICALVFLTFLGGALVMLSDTFPAGPIRDAYRGGTALYEKLFRYHDRYATDLWNKARTERRGVTVLEDGHVYPGLTLYTSGDGAHALLVDLEGNTAHKWQRPFSSVWDETSAVPAPVPDTQIYFRKARVFPNGDLLALYEGVGDSPYGYGIVMLTADSEVVWKNLDNFHHDFDLTPQGRVVGLTHTYRQTALEHADQFEPPYMEDFLVVVDADGRTRQKLSLLDAINASKYRSLLWRVPYYSMEDPLHANAVDYLDRDKAASLARTVPAAREGQVLVSFRELAGGSIALVDLEAQTVVWATRGPWLAQHDPDILPNGRILVFDNRGNVAAATKSRVLEVDPATGGITWTYAGDPEHPLDSPIRAAQERLPNGNTLITESSGGRLVEIDRNGRIVWEYINPVRGGATGDLTPVVSWAQRVPAGTLQRSFAERLAPTRDQAPVEAAAQ